MYLVKQNWREMKRVFIPYLLFCAVLGAVTISTTNKQKLELENDLMPQEEILQEVAKTKTRLIARLIDEKIPDEKDPRNKFFVGVDVGLAYNPKGGFGYYVGTQVGYNFLVQQNNSFRVFAFADRFGNAIGNYHISFPQRDFSIWRVGISAEYRAYFHQYFGFKVRLISYGIRNLTHEYVGDSARIQRKVGFLPTVAFGPLFNYKYHEVFVGFDMLDYDFKDGISVNFLQYSFKF